MISIHGKRKKNVLRRHGTMINHLSMEEKTSSWNTLTMERKQSKGRTTIQQFHPTNPMQGIAKYNNHKGNKLLCDLPVSKRDQRTWEYTIEEPLGTLVYS